MPSHMLWRIAWGLTWRWLVLFASLIAPAPTPAIAAVGIVLGAGFVSLVWRRRDFLGSGWRVLLAIAVANLGFWLGSPMLVPAVTLALGIVVLDLWWSIRGVPSVLAAVPAAPAVAPIEPVGTAIEPAWTALEPAGMALEPYQPRPAVVITPRRRSSRSDTAAGLRLLVAACMLVTICTVAAFTMASRVSAGLSSAIGQRIDQITAAVPAVSSPAQATAAPTPTPSPTPDPITALFPNGTKPQLPSDQLAPRLDLPGLCVSLPNHRYEVRLPNGQVIVVTTKRRDGCPDLASILKALQEAGSGGNN